MQTDEKRRILIFALFFVSGVTGLVYEIAWTRMFVTVFGSTTHAVSTVLAAFMAGLALGSITLGRFGDRFSRPILAYGVLELIIGVYALLVPWLIENLTSLYSLVFSTFGQQPLPVAILRFLLSFLVILIPTTLMGGTLPVLSKYAGRDISRVGRNVGTLYALNTFGAVVGSFITGFFLLEILGASSSVYLAAAASIVVGLAATASGWRMRMSEAPEPGKAPSGGKGPPEYVARVVLLCFAVSGGAALAYEVLYTKVLVFSLGSTAHAFSLMLTTFLVGLALGSFVAARLIDRWRSPAELFGIVEILIGATAFVSIYLLSKLDLTHHYLALRDAGEGLLRIRGIGFLQAATIMLVPTLFMGAAFPIVTRIYTKRNLVSSSVGRIYFFNTIGAVIGSLAAGFLLVPLLGSARSIALMATLNIAAGVLLFSCAGRRRLWAGASAVALAALLVITSLIRPSVFAGPFNIAQEGSTLVYFKEGVSGTVTVHRYGEYDLLAINGVDVAGTSDMLRITQKLQGHLPVLLAGGAQRIAHIGFGSGETLRTLTLHPVGIIDGVEICRDVISVARRFFSVINRNVFDDPKVNIIIMDGKNYILLTGEQYDIIMTDSIYPGSSGASALYSYDHFMKVREKLKLGGVASCWLPLDLSPQDLKVALKAFNDAFPDMSLWYFYMNFSQHALLVGRKDTAIDIDLSRFARAFGDSAIGADFESILISDPFTLISCFLADGSSVRRFCGDAPRHSDDHPILEFGIARRGKGIPHLSSNLNGLLTLRPNPLSYVSEFRSAGIDSAQAAQALLSKIAISSSIIKGHAYNAIDEAGAARAHYEKALAIEPDSPIALQVITALDETIGGLEAAARAGRDDYSAVYALGVRYLSEGRYEEALSTLERALSLRPDLPHPHISIGECYLRWRKPKEALEYFLEAQRMLPEDDGILLRLGICYDALDRKSEAAEAYAQAIQLNPDSYEARNNLGNIYLSDGQTEKARNQFEVAERMDPARPHAVHNLGLTFAREANWEKAKIYFTKALSISPEFYPAHYSLGNTLLELGDIDGARAEWQKTLILRPDHAGARQKLATQHP